MSNLFRSLLRSPAVRSTSRSFRTSAPRFASPTPLNPPPIARRELAIAASLIGFATIGGAALYFNQPPLLCEPESAEIEEVDPPSAFLHATGKHGTGKVEGKPLWNRDEVTVVVVIGGPRAGKTEQVTRIAKTFDMTIEDAESDIYTDIALNVPTAHLSSPTGSSQLRIVLDSPFTTSDPLAEAKWFEANLAPILLFMFVDCPLEDAMKRAGSTPSAELKKEYDEWVERFTPLIKHYRLQGNFLEMVCYSDLWQPPVVRQWLVDGRLYREAEERTPSRFELFFESRLVYLGRVRNLEAGFARELNLLLKNVFQSSQLAKHFGFISLQPNALAMQLKSVVSLGVDDVAQRVQTLIIMITLIGYSANASAISIGHGEEEASTAEEERMPQRALVAAVAFFVIAKACRGAESSPALVF
ncbi:hypothetical protein P7C70_g4291, partial [Phenoliferia sp. Uapishka_3]